MLNKIIKTKILMNKIAKIAVFALALCTVTVVSYAQTAPTQIINNATVNSPTTDLNPNNNNAQTTDKLCYKADMAITLSDSVTTVRPLSTDVYTSTLSNAGPSTVTELEYTFTYDNRDFQSFAGFTTTNGTLSAPTTVTNGNLVTMTFTISNLSLANGQSLVVSQTGTATANPQASVNTSATVKPTGPMNNDPTCTMQDPNTANNTAPDVTAGTLEADLSIVKISSGGASSATGAIGSMDSKTDQLYTLTITNNGPSDAQPVIVIEDTVPAEVTPSNVTGTTCTAGPGSTAGLTCTYDPLTRKMQFSYNQVLPNGAN
ncbi:MAG: hypothetical protein ACRCXZ_07795, partial [Patescibacteria group bacterium]